jgi:hypothetical protein
MKHVTYGEKSLLVGDEAADLLIRYASLISEHRGSDVVTLHAIGADGNDVDASFLLNSATNLMVESASTEASEPDNRLEVGYLHERIEDLTRSFELPAEGPRV